MSSLHARVLLIALCGPAVACTHRVPETKPLSPADTTIVFFSGQTQAGGLFPQISDSTRILKGGAVRAAPDAPPCQFPAVDTNDWVRVTTSVPSRYLRHVSFRLPPEFSEEDLSRDPEFEPIPEGSGEYWEHILGSWDFFEGAWPAVHHSSVAMWIGPDEGYPTSGIGGTDVRQTFFTECRLITPAGNLTVALFTIESSEPMVSGYHAFTYWQLDPGVFVSAAASGPTPAVQAKLLTSLSTIQVQR